MTDIDWKARALASESNSRSLQDALERAREELGSFAIYTVEDDIGALYVSANGKKAWVSIGSNVAPVLLQIDAIQRSVLLSLQGGGGGSSVAESATEGDPALPSQAPCQSEEGAS